MKIRNILYILGVFTLTISCTEDFEIINENPNAPTEVEPEFLLRQVIYNYGEHMAYEGFVAGNLLGQYFTAVDFNLFDRHSLSEPQFGGNPWPVIFQNLRDNEIILQRSKESPSYEVYEGPSLILKAYMTSALTDIFGDVPYKEALQGKNGIISPAYDRQEDIYLGTEGILENLKNGIEKINSYAGAFDLKGDVLYDGDLNMWIKFANSLRIKMLMRISSKVDISVELNDIYDSGNYIKEASENAAFDFSNSAPNNFRMATARVGDFNIYVMSETIDEIFDELNDPRQEVFFRAASNSGEYSGLLNGPDASTTSISVGDYSLAGEIFREKTGTIDANFITSWEVKFFLAEAAVKGYITADAKSLYEDGVGAAFKYWNTPLPENYLKEGPASFIGDSKTQLTLIGTQKWLANIINGFEGWIEYRRTGIPNLKTVAASLNNDLIPVRMPYPIDEEALNGENFAVAAEVTDGNSINALMWWDE